MTAEVNVASDFVWRRIRGRSVRSSVSPEEACGWQPERLASEVFPPEWRQVDFDGGGVRLDPGSTKNGKGRVFPMTAELRKVLTAQHAENERLQKTGVIVPWCSWRLLAERRGGQEKLRMITTFTAAWKKACRAAGCPGRIPHDLRRTAVRNFVRNGIPERVAMRLTGHKTPSVFARYDIVSDGDLRDAARKLDASVTDSTLRETKG
jgi:integrase